jgi:hypothetical protein
MDILYPQNYNTQSGTKHITKATNKCNGMKKRDLTIVNILYLELQLPSRMRQIHPRHLLRRRPRIWSRIDSVILLRMARTLLRRRPLFYG